LISRRQFVGGVAGGVALGGLAGAAASPERPNIVYIMADDMGWADLATYGRDDVRTPHIDSLARDGMRFDNAYANSAVCTPTRVALITGRYQHRQPIGNEEPLGANPVGLEPGVATLPATLRAVGYQTSLVGKWHLGTDLKYSPLRHGYDRFWGFRPGAIDYFRHSSQRRPAEPGAPAPGPSVQNGLWDGDTPVQETGYLTDLIGNHAVDEVRRMSGNRKPFLLSLHFTAPHWPWEGPGDAELAQSVTNIMHYDGGTIATYRAMIESLDANVGRVLDALKQAGVAGNTLVVFTSDNGGERFAKNWPYSGIKGELLEGGIRVPLLMRWPGRIRRGSRSNQVAMTMDYLPTFAELAGATPDPAQPPDGISLARTLADPSYEQQRTVFWRFKAHDQAAVRRGRYKYLRIEGAEYLFDVVADPQERGNLKTHNPQEFENLRTAWQQWNAALPPYIDSNPSLDNKAQRARPDRY
jgi:arylsulfatase A-like enzyme